MFSQTIHLKKIRRRKNKKKKRFPRIQAASRLESPLPVMARFTEFNYHTGSLGHSPDPELVS